MVDADGHETGFRVPDTFDSLVATPPAGNSRIDPSTVLDFSDRPTRERKHASPLEWVGLVLAVILPPLGLLVTVAARIVTRRRHGWTTRVAVAATAISIVLTVVLAGGAVYLKSVNDADAAAEALLVEAAPLCEALAATPDILAAPAYGWPTDVTALPVTLEAMKAYQVHWSELAQLAPAAAQANVAAIADQAQILVSAVETSQSIDRPGNLAIMSTITDASGLPGWVARNCS
jgi:hypothetical protein